MSEGRDKYKNLLDKIEQLTTTDPEFRKAMEERFGQNSIYLNKIKQIEKYLGLDFSLDKIDSIIDYSFVDNEYVRLQLISDNREMLRYRYGTRGHKIDFLEFCRYAHMQAEMLVNYYFDKQYKGDIDKIVAAINYQYKTETTTLSSINYISKCIYVKKKFGIKGSNLENLAKARNIQSHRSVGNVEIDLSYVEVIKKSGLYLNRDKDDFDWFKIQTDANQKNAYDTIYNNDEKYKNYQINLWISKQPYDSVIETLNILAKMISTKVGIGEVVDLDKIKTFEKKMKRSVW